MNDRLQGLLGVATVLGLIWVPQVKGEENLITQNQTASIAITAIKLEPTSTGLSLLLETTQGSLATPISRSQNNLAFIDIPQAILQAQPVRQENPLPGIAYLEVKQEVNNFVRVIIAGSSNLPEVTITPEVRGLSFAVSSPVAEAQKTSQEVTQKPNEEIELTVTGDRTQGYRRNNSETATRTDTPLKDVPQSIQIIPRQVIEDRAVTELGQVLETGGVISRGLRGTSVVGPGFLIRGFLVNDNILRDGIPRFSLAPLDSSDIDRVEILRGPASVLFGLGEPGGVINLISKQPLREPFAAVTVTAGSFNDYRGDVDLSGPLNEDKSVRFRTNISFQDYDSFRDFVQGQRFIFSPTITWDISTNTSLNIYGQYVRNRETIDQGVIATSNGIIDLPRNRFLGEEFAEFSQDEISLGYQLNHRFSNNWSARHAFNYLFYSPRRFAPLFDGFDPETGNLDRLAFFAGGFYQRIFTNTEVTGKFDTGPLAHQVLLGVEYRNTQENPEFQFSNRFTPINIFNPIYTPIPYAIRPEFFRDDTVNNVGIYLQDQVNLLPNLKLLLGGRYDFIDQLRTERNIGEERQEFPQSDSAFSPRVGIVYQPIEPVSLYASYNRSFIPSFGAFLNSDGSQFKPETGEQFEVGMKVDISPQLNLTVAAFDLRRQNVTTPDPNNPQFSVQTGEVTSRGIEVNLGGEILPGWNITSSYNFLDVFVSRDNRDIVGNRFANVPDNQFSLFSTYTIQQGSLEGLGFGLGLFFVGERPGNNDNTFVLPSYFRTDGAIFYKRKNWRAQVNIENLFNINYFTSSDEFLGVIPGRPLAVSGRLTVEF